MEADYTFLQKLKIVFLAPLVSLSPRHQTVSFILTGKNESDFEFNMLKYVGFVIYIVLIVLLVLLLT